MTESPYFPPAEGARVAWRDVPSRVRAAVENGLGERVVSAVNQPGGFSPGVAARVQLADGRRYFVKAVGAELNPLSPGLHRREAQIMTAMPSVSSVPRLLWSMDEGDPGWVALVLEDIQGRQPGLPWVAADLELILRALNRLSDQLTPSPIPIEVAGSIGSWFGRHGRCWDRLRKDATGLDEWSIRNIERLARLESGAPAAAAGDSLLHFDLRADNMLLTKEGVKVVDWPHARIGAAWVDLIAFAPSVAMQGGPAPEDLFAMYDRARGADPEAVTAVVVAVAGFFTWHSLQPAPPGLPTIREFQAAQAEVTRGWIRARTAWS